MTKPLQTLSPAQCAELLTCHVKTVLKWIRDGKLRARRVGCRWKVLETDLEAFFRRGSKAG